MEPIERIKFDVSLDHISVVMDRLNKRLGNVIKTIEKDADVSQMIVDIPTRGLFGFQSELMAMLGLELKIETEFLGYQEYKGELDV